MKKIVVLLFAGCLSCGVSIADESAQDVLTKMRERYESLQDAQFTFSEKTLFGMTKIEQQVSGTLLLKKENKYRIELNGRTIVTDGKTVWSYSAQNNQVLIDDFKMDERSISPQRILAGAPEDYVPTLLGREKSGKLDLIVLKLLPRDEQSFIKSMKVWVDDDEWMVRKVELVEAGGKQTVYVVDDVKVNIGVTDSRFAYEIPQGADVVDLR